jgi:hypothetical protein
VKRLTDACSVKRVDDVGWRQWRTALACGHTRQRSEHLCGELLVEGAEIRIRIDHGDRMVLLPFRGSGAAPPAVSRPPKARDLASWIITDPENLADGE